jgi:hypothetical protein
MRTVYLLSKSQYSHSQRSFHCLAGALPLNGKTFIGRFAPDEQGRVDQRVFLGARADEHSLERTPLTRLRPLVAYA